MVPPFLPSACRSLALLLAIYATAARLEACQPARIDVSLNITAGQAAVTGVPLYLKIQIKDESGNVCAAGRAYPIHLDAADASGQAVPISSADVTLAQGQAETPAVRSSFINVKTPGLITIKATSNGLRPGVANIFVHAPQGAPRARRIGTAMFDERVFFVPAAYVRVANDVSVTAYCGKGGEVSANGIDSIVIYAELMNGVLPYDLTLHFATGRIDWDGAITIPKGATNQGKEIRSHRTGSVQLDQLLSSEPPGIRFDPQGAQASCKDMKFISPAQYADLQLAAGSISFGEPVQLAIFIRDSAYNVIPLEDKTAARIKEVAGRLASFSAPAAGDGGSASLICKPNWWGHYEFQYLDDSLKTGRLLNSVWAEGPIQLTVTFPWIPLSLCVLFGSLGAVLLALYQGNLQAGRLPARIAVGVGAAILMVSVALQASLLKPTFQPYTLMIVALSLVGGWSGPAVFNRYAQKFGVGSNQQAPEEQGSGSAAAAG